MGGRIFGIFFAICIFSQNFLFFSSPSFNLPAIGADDPKAAAANDNNNADGAAKPSFVSQLMPKFPSMSLFSLAAPDKNTMTMSSVISNAMSCANCSNYSLKGRAPGQWMSQIMSNWSRFYLNYVLFVGFVVFVSILTKPTLLVVLILFVAGRFYIWSKLPPSFELKITPLGCNSLT